MSFIEVRTHKPKPLSWWLNEYKRGRINMQPGYQRRSNLWGRWKKAHLIDSVINGFDVPKFYVADFDWSGSELNETSSRYAVIDGKQRFEALFDYLLGELTLNASSKYGVDPKVSISGLGIYDLRDRYPAIAERIESFEPVVMSVATDTAGMIEELFVRLNSGVSINGAERRNAMPGPLPPIIRDVTVHPFFGERVKFSKDRMQEFNLAAKLLMFEHQGGFSETKARNLDAFVLDANKATIEVVSQLDTASAGRHRTKAKALQEEYELLVAPYKEAEELVMENLDAMTNIFIERDPLLSKQGSIPVYYWVLRKNKKMRRKFREFLKDFDPKVLANVRLARVRPDDADSELLTYYNASRTSNDRASMQERYNILVSRFNSWNGV